MFAPRHMPTLRKKFLEMNHANAFKRSRDVIGVSLFDLVRMWDHQNKNDQQCLWDFPSSIGRIFE